MFFVAWKKLDWSVTKSLLVSVFFAFQLAALAISWQFYRNVFGVMVLLFAIPLIKNDIGWKGMVALSVLAFVYCLGSRIGYGFIILYCFWNVGAECFEKREDTL